MSESITLKKEVSHNEKTQRIKKGRNQRKRKTEKRVSLRQRRPHRKSKGAQKMSSHIYRRKVQRNSSQVETAEIPAWAGLQKMSSDDLRQLADGMGIEWVGRMKTASAINRARSE
jgi:hypothetical protein